MKLGIFVVPEYHPEKANGGAENVCRLLSLSLCKYYETIVFHSEIDCSVKLGKVVKHEDTLCSINAFYLDEWSKNRGEITLKFCSLAKEMIEQCDLVISFERTLVGLIQPQITVLGGISYQHCRDIAQSREWNKLIVPSAFIKKRCCEIGTDENNIVVIPNGIRCENFYPKNNRLTKNALLPFRPDIGKGFIESIDFINAINQEKIYGEYKIVIPKLLNSDFAEDSFYDTINSYAAKKRVVIQYVPWGTEDKMNSIYNNSDFILSLGTLEEGFGLTTIEAILSGRYVVTRRLGATPELLPNHSGILFIEDNSICEILKKINNSFPLNEELHLGREYILANYSIEKMSHNFINLINNTMHM